MTAYSSVVRHAFLHRFVPVAAGTEVEGGAKDVFFRKTRYTIICILTQALDVVFNIRFSYD